MDIRPLSETYAVSPQIAVEDLEAIRDAGYRAVIDNRPDAEIPDDLHTSEMQARAEALGLAFFANPVIGGALTMQNVVAQAEAIAAAPGPVLAYCASGNRSSIVWALSQAGTQPAADLIAAAARHGYQLAHLEPQIEALAAQKSAG
ncbi:TIGR01244 family sulfur transferase [Pseudogemmobacter bohemicus]|uniref:TIGR01244 family sulfur transferase n=1 Tax=Pseudogemmobacter bohemicus TaxID=2250708 RepID=UPI000DD396D0|nr:TIGR01244 family sulfur transferase [Pseudogemmobacter bohemicus]